MSQEYSNRRQRRTNRARGGRPVLVNPSDPTTTPSIAEQATTPRASETATAEAEPLPPTPAASPQRRLPRFFSNVSKNEEAQDTQEREQAIAQARIARATRNKPAVVPAAKSNDEVANAKTSTKPAAQTSARPTSATRPASTQTGFFKTRYIIGLGIYLIVADFVGVYEANLLTQLKLERVLTSFSLFGLPIRVSTSTLVFLATLVIVLVALAYFDLLPRSLGSARSTGTGSTRSTSSSSTPGERTSQPSMRQGVKGADDDLYQAYRSNQRREKKR